MRLSPKLLVLLAVAAGALSAPPVAFARTKHVATARAHTVPHRARADANGYFYFRGNYFDDAYVYDNAQSRRDTRGTRNAILRP